jgi:alanine dehydrogenase
MRIGVPKEIKKLEHRVGLVPDSVKKLTAVGHEVIVETNAGASINFTDKDYEAAGAKIAKTAKDIFASTEMIVKVKEPQPEECKMLREDQVLFTYLHLAADKPQAEALMKSKCVAIAYETVTGADGRGLPLLLPMSEVAGRLSIQVGSYSLMKHKGGTGRLLGGVTGVGPAKTLIIGGGVSGFNAAQMAVGMQSDVVILEKSEARIKELRNYFGNGAKVALSTPENIKIEIMDSDLIIGAVLVPGASAPKLVTKDMLKTMLPGAVMVDISIDQGGCFETSRATTHADPTYVVDGIVHYCVANMPGSVPLTSALALNHAVLPYALALANKGWKEALRTVPGFLPGLNVCKGEVTHKAVAESLGLPYSPKPAALAA